MLPPGYLEKFKKLYYKKFKVRLSDEEATRAATDLLDLFVVLSDKSEKKKR